MPQAGESETSMDQSMDTHSGTSGGSNETIQQRPEARPPTKRRMVDANGQEILDPKRARAEPDANLKINALGLLLHWHEYLIKTFKIDNVSKIDTIADVTSHLWAFHTKLRQEANRSGSAGSAIQGTNVFRCNGVEVTWDVVKPRIVKLAELYGFTYETSERGRNATGTLGSILALFDLYRPKFNEVRMGTQDMVVRKRDNVVDVMSIRRFGLRPEHAIFTTGCTFNPTLQSSSKMTLGPMTIAINLAQQTHAEYQGAWKKAFVQAFKLFPDVNEIANLLAGSRDEHDSVLKVMADIAMWGTTRSTNKASFPFAMMLSVARRYSTYCTFFSGETPNVALEISKMHERIKDIDFSGAGAYRFWNLASTMEFKMRAGPALTIRTQQEMLTHAVWGTQKEDLGLLEWATGHSFQTRRQMGKQFVGRGEGPETTPFKPISFAKVCKLANASQSDFLSGGRGQISRGFVFSGKCTQRVDLESELFKTLLATQPEYVDRTSNRSRILSKLNAVKESIMNKVKKDQTVAFGTTDWYYYNVTDGYGEKVNSSPSLNGVYFYGQDE